MAYTKRFLGNLILSVWFLCCAGWIAFSLAFAKFLGPVSLFLSISPMAASWIVMYWAVKVRKPKPKAEGEGE